MTVPIATDAIPMAEWAPYLHNHYAARHRDKPAPVVKRLLRFHHSVTVAPDLVPPFVDEYEAMRELHRIGVARFGSGVPYNYGIMPNGRLYQGMPVDTKSTHSAEPWDANYQELSAVFVGRYDTGPLTDAQSHTASRLIASEHLAGRLVDTTAHWHAQVYPTACPGSHAIATMRAITYRAHRIIEDGEDDTMTPEDMNKLADMTAERVWAAIVGRDLADKPRPASWLLTSAQRMAARAARNTHPGPSDPEEDA